MVGQCVIDILWGKCGGQVRGKGALMITFEKWDGSMGVA